MYIADPGVGSWADTEPEEARVAPLHNSLSIGSFIFHASSKNLQSGVAHEEGETDIKVLLSSCTTLRTPESKDRTIVPPSSFVNVINSLLVE